MNIWKDCVVCPYDKNHIIRNCNVQYHIPVCKEKHQNPSSLTCRFDCQRLCQEDPEFLCQTVPENGRSKSKRRRDSIRERRLHKNHKPEIIEPQNSDSCETAAEMDDKPEMWDLEEQQGAWGGFMKKKRSQKNHGQAFNYNGEPSQGSADQRSKTAKKRAQKKLRKEKGFRDNVPADKSDEKKKYVIKLNESVTVTETHRPRREVYFHYPTRRLLSPDSVPKTGLGIQPMMLQRVCFEAFMRMQCTSGGERRRTIVPPPDLESRAIQFFFGGAANGDISSVNENKNKTAQGSGETASGGTPGIKTTQASDGKLNADLYCPKRYKPKKDKKRSHPRATHNAAKSSSLEEIPLEDRFAKYMLFDDEVMPPPRPRPDKNSFPVPYMEIEDAGGSGQNEELKNPVKYVDCDIRPYLREYEWEDEKEEESMDENENANAEN